MSHARGVSSPWRGMTDISWSVYETPKFSYLPPTTQAIRLDHACVCVRVRAYTYEVRCCARRVPYGAKKKSQKCVWTREIPEHRLADESTACRQHEPHIKIDEGENIGEQWKNLRDEKLKLFRQVDFRCFLILRTFTVHFALTLLTRSSSRILSSNHRHIGKSRFTFSIVGNKSLIAIRQLLALRMFMYTEWRTIFSQLLRCLSQSTNLLIRSGCTHGG